MVKGAIVKFIFIEILRLLDKKPSYKEINEFFDANPYSESTKVLIDGLYRFDTRALLFEFPSSHLDPMLPMPAIGFDRHNGMLPLIITEIDHETVHFKEPAYIDNNLIFRKKSVSRDRFYEVFSSDLLLMETNTKSEQEVSKSNYGHYMIFLCITLALAVLLFTPFLLAPYLNLLYVSNIIGMFVCLFMILDDVSQTSYASIVCGNGKANCKKLFESEKSRFLGEFRYVDMGISFFAFNCIYLVLFTLSGTLSIAVLAVMSFVGLVFVIHLGYKMVNMRKMCPLCLIIQAAVIAQFAVFIMTRNQLILLDADVGNTLLAVCLVGAISGSMLSTIIPLFRQVNAHNPLREEARYFKYNGKIFRKLYEDNPLLTRDNNAGIKPFTFGDANASDVLTLGISFFCGSCGRLAREIESILFLYPDIKIHVFIKTESSGEILMHNYIYNQYRQSTKDGNRAFQEVFTNGRLPISGKQMFVSDSCVKEHNEWFIIHGFEHTPIVLYNGKALPIYYSAKELKVMIKELAVA